MLASIRAVPARLWALSLLSSLLQVLPFPVAGPVPLWRRMFCWFCLTPLLAALLSKDRQGARLDAWQAAGLSYLSGFAWYLGNCYWIFPTMHVYGNIAPPIAAGILVLFSLYVGLYHALFGGIMARLHGSYGRQTALLMAPLAWVAVELARARITGFPWDLLGCTQVDNFALTRLAPLTGVMGLSLVVAFVNTLWLTGWAGKFRFGGYAGPLSALLIVTILSAAGLQKPAETNPTASALLLQENLKVGAEATGPPESKTQLLASFDELSLHPGTASVSPATSVSSMGRPQVVVWPEAPNDFFDDEPIFRTNLGNLARQMDAPVISDSVTIKQRPSDGKLLELYNSASFFTAQGNHAGRYDKMHLVPFGEYTPYKRFFFFAGHLLDNVGPFVPGSSRNLFETNGHRYGVFICYESIFGGEIRQFAKSGADVLVNISDDGWYGDSSAPWEHLDMVRMRAIENHRWILRATNTGVTASIDPEGRIVAQMPRHIRSSILAPFGYEDTQTFYTRHGDWLAWLCAGVTAVAVAAGLLRKREVH